MQVQIWMDGDIVPILVQTTKLYFLIQLLIVVK